MTTPLDHLPEFEKLEKQLAQVEAKKRALEDKFQEPESSAIRFLPRTLGYGITSTELFAMCRRLTEQHLEDKECFNVLLSHKDDYLDVQEWIAKEHGSGQKFYSTVKALGHVKIRNLSIAEGLGLTAVHEEAEKLQAAWREKMEELIWPIARYVPKNIEEAEKKKWFLDYALNEHGCDTGDDRHFVEALIDGLSDFKLGEAAA